MCGQGLGMNITIVYKMLCKLQNDDKNIARSARYAVFIFFSLDISFHFFQFGYYCDKKYSTSTFSVPGLLWLTLLL